MRSLLILALVIIFQFGSAYSQKVDPKDVTIARDEWGTPHIFAPTDPGVAYGLAWANCEDHFETIQEALAIGKGMMGRLQGRDGAPYDFFSQSTGARSLVEEKYETEVSPDFKRYLEGYCQGANAFAKAHKDRIRFKKLFPVHPKDVLTTYVISFAALNGVVGAVQRAVEGKDDLPEEQLALGSNAFALSSSRTTDNRTYLCINPHFKLEGPLSFYEAHLHSEEGMNIAGALFQGGSCVFMGANEHLGWGMTYNYFDAVDSYRLKMHPKKKLWYEVDGEWHKLKKNPVWLKVKVKGITVPVRRMAYESMHGPVFESEGGQFYAVRAPSLMTIQSAEQFYRMDRSENLEDFRDAMDLQGISKFNVVYADEEDNIYYVSNGNMPVRDSTYDSSGLLPGEESAAIWQRIYTIDELPHVLNPECGYVFNTNNSPFLATCEGENDDPDRLPGTVDLRPGNNNRAERLKELISEREQHDFEGFKAIKFDNRFTENSYFWSTIQPLFDINPADHPDLKEEIEIVQNWDRVADPSSVGAAHFEITLNYVFEKMGYGDNAFVLGCHAEEPLYLEAFAHTRDHMMKHFGTLQVPLKEIHRFEYEGQDYASYGFPDVLAATYAKPWKEGKYHLVFGDSYILALAFGPNGLEASESLLPYGKQSFDSSYSSQLDLYNQQKLKPMPLDKETVLKHAVRVYHPE